MAAVHKLVLCFLLKVPREFVPGAVGGQSTYPEMGARFQSILGQLLLFERDFVGL